MEFRAAPTSFRRNPAHCIDLGNARPIWSGLEEPVAQPVEHLTFNQRVSGSNPDGLTNLLNDLAAISAVFPSVR